MAASESLSQAQESRKAEHFRLLVIFAVLVTLIALPGWLWTRHEKNRPTVVEARVVSATSADPVFREGARSVADDESVQLAAAIRLEYPGKGSRWLAPVEELVLDGEAVDHLNQDDWPEEDRHVRVFWFTLETPFLGGRLTAENADAKLTLQSFFAPELGRSLMAEGEPEAHADDGVNLGDEALAVAAGTYRIYARVEVVKKVGSSHPLQVATSPDADAQADPRLLRISRRLSPAVGLDPLAGELFRLPGFEHEGTGYPDIEHLAVRRLAVSSEIFAAVAVAGETRFEDGELEAVSAFRWQNERITTPSNPWRWGSHVQPRDILRQGDHWMVAVSDDGDGVLGPGDVVAHSWRRPAVLLSLASALENEPPRVELHRFVRGPQ